MNSRLKIVSMSLLAVAVCLCFAQGLSAQSSHVTAFAVGIHAVPGLIGSGCGYFTPATPVAPVRPPNKSGQAPSETGKSSVEQSSAQELLAGRGSIVGLWSVQFVSEGSEGIPDGAVIDQGYATWHSDGTEIMNSGRPPITGSFCMGVWKSTGRFTYKLNHFALSWDPTGTTFVGPGNIRENLTLDHGGDSYSGTFTIDQYDTNGNLLAHVQGNVTGQRITAD